ncbi:hypothetical protein URS_2199 [Acinetobacter ursingii]|nr:hypothetical protein URS_2199 [Acinetobacter ursingii]
MTFLLCYCLFLNGVCRHELFCSQSIGGWCFLNGVCRHEPSSSVLVIPLIFLNGVCRHELLTLHCIS